MTLEISRSEVSTKPNTTHQKLKKNSDPTQPMDGPNPMTNSAPRKNEATRSRRHLVVCRTFHVKFVRKRRENCLSARRLDCPYPTRLLCIACRRCTDIGRQNCPLSAVGTRCWSPPTSVRRTRYAHSDEFR